MVTTQTARVHWSLAADSGKNGFTGFPKRMDRWQKHWQNLEIVLEEGRFGATVETWQGNIDVSNIYALLTGGKQTQHERLCKQQNLTIMRKLDDAHAK